jgi:hypothetical protein
MVTSSATTISLEWSPAFDDGGSPIAQYELEMDEVEGNGLANTELWLNVFTGHSLSYTVTSGLQSTFEYRFRVRAVSEY